MTLSDVKTVLDELGKEGFNEFSKSYRILTSKEAVEYLESQGVYSESKKPFSESSFLKWMDHQ
jgi:hypothetical protein